MEGLEEKRLRQSRSDRTAPCELQNFPSLLVLTVLVAGKTRVSTPIRRCNRYARRSLPGVVQRQVPSLSRPSSLIRRARHASVRTGGTLPRMRKSLYGNHLERENWAACHRHRHSNMSIWQPPKRGCTVTRFDALLNHAQRCAASPPPLPWSLNPAW